MNTVKFDDLDSWFDFGLVLTDKSVDIPEVKIDEVEVPGRNGTIILTKPEDVRFGNGTFHFTFTVIGNQNFFSNVLENFSQKIHGKSKRIVLSWRPNQVFNGLCKINSANTDKKLSTIGVDVSFQPEMRSIYNV